jgi:G:T/U-mismatch repair DNA glycosylase
VYSMTAPLLEGFPPVVDDTAGLLILGSFPSVASLASGQYYGNPRNAFWQITSALFGFDAAASYETRLIALQSACFNGSAAQQLFSRLVDVDANVEYRTLPSTSPARAMPAGRKLQAWRSIAPS